MPIIQINHMQTLQCTLYSLWVVGGLFTKSYPTLCDPMDCSPPGSSVHGILQAIILEWFAISFSRGSSQPREQTWVSCTADRFFTKNLGIQILQIPLVTSPSYQGISYSLWTIPNGIICDNKYINFAIIKVKTCKDKKKFSIFIWSQWLIF